MVPDNLNLDFFLSPLDTSISKNIKTSIKKPWTKSFSDTLTLFQPGPMQRLHQKCPRGYISELHKCVCVFNTQEANCCCCYLIRTREKLIFTKLIISIENFRNQNVNTVDEFR